MAGEARVYRGNVLSLQGGCIKGGWYQCSRQATKDPFYLKVGERVLEDIQRRVKTSCGFATMRDVETGEVSLPELLIRVPI